jgi:HD superfamily phosphodiesterase
VKIGAVVVAAERVEVPDSGVLIDLDTPSDYALARLLAGELPEGGAVPEHIRRHMKTVANLAATLGALLNVRGGCGLNLLELELAALVHDIRRAEPRCGEPRRGESRHAAAAARTLADAGHPRLAEIVRQHMMPDEAEWGRVSEVTALYIADKMADGERVLPLEERYAKRIEGLSGEGRRAAERNLAVASALKSRMEALIGEKITPSLLSPPVLGVRGDFSA